MASTKRTPKHPRADLRSGGLPRGGLNTGVLEVFLGWKIEGSRSLELLVLDPLVAQEESWKIAYKVRSSEDVLMESMLGTAGRCHQVRATWITADHTLQSVRPQDPNVSFSAS